MIDPQKWGAFVVSCVILALFSFVVICSLLILHGLPSDQGTQQIVGALIAGVSGVLGYWIGSSAGSKSKDEALAKAAAAPASSQSEPIGK